MPRITDPQELEKIARLTEIREKNNSFAWLLSDYLSQNPRQITRELMESLTDGDARFEETVYTALLAGLCGLDTENREQDRQMAETYFQPAVTRLDPAVYRANPYFRNITIPAMTLGNWELTHETYHPYEAFIWQDIVVTEDFREIPQLGFFSEEFSFPVVKEQGHEWMAIKPNEIETMQPAIDLVTGRVIAFGLGLGYFACMASLKPEVQHITIVEQNPDVIELFRQIILPQFSQKSKISLVRADAFDYAANQLPRENFDYAFVDLWHDASDGPDLYFRMKKLEQAAPRTHFLYWIEETLLSALRWQVFDEIIENARSFREIQTRLSKPFLREIALHQ